MITSQIYYARGDSNTANNAEINVRPQSQVPVTAIQFVKNPNVGGDLILDFVPDDGDVDTMPEPDPDTRVIIGGNTYNFCYIKNGQLEPARVPAALANDPVFVIAIDYNGDGNFQNDGNNILFFTTSPDGTAANMAAISNGAMNIAPADLTPPPDPVCFCAGTELATPGGLRQVETLRPGDTVLSEDGRVVQVAWVGLSRYSAADLARDPSRRPVRIPANAFGPGLPVRDLDVSPQHRIVVEGPECELLFGMPRIFVVARHLLGTIAHTPEIDGPVRYVHLLLENHDIVVGNGLPSESFQPARRMLDLMTGPNQRRLTAALEVLGMDAMLKRPDALTTLSSREAVVLLRSLRPLAPPVSVGASGHEQRLN